MTSSMIFRAPFRHKRESQQQRAADIEHEAEGFNCGGHWPS